MPTFEACDKNAILTELMVACIIHLGFKGQLTEATPLPTPVVKTTPKICVRS